MEEMRIDLVDFFMKPSEVQFWQNEVKNFIWNIAEYDIYKDKPNLSGMSADITNEDLRGLLDERVIMQAKELTNKELKIQRVYVNAWRANEVTYPHIDKCHTTCLIYLNADYDIAYGGETIFYEDEQNAHYAVTPHPGRAVFFDGMLTHKATSFNHLYNGYRHTIAYKLGE
tara:strand:+ start:288 stop:800 length:513 start_codon:yes stop_codon:yes gene_type:complete